MANEKRLIEYINREEVCKLCDNQKEYCGKEKCPVYKAPATEAVPVVRCKDCKWVEKGKDYEAYCNHWKSGLYANVKADDFCSYGERREGE